MTVKTLTVSGLNVAAQVLGGTGLASSTTNGVTTLSVSSTQSFSSLSIGTIGYTIDDYATNNQIRLYTTTAGKSLWVNAPGGITLNNNTYVTGNLQVAATTTDVYANIINTATGGRSWFINATSNASGEGAGRLLFKDGTASATRMTIDASGNVGIGTTSPNAKLEVDGNIIIRGASGGNSWTNQRLLFAGDGTGYKLSIGSINNLGTINTSAVTIQDNGYVGIGTTSPATTLEIAGTGFAGLQMKRRTDNPQLSTALYFDSVAAYGTITLSGTTLTVVSTTGPASTWAVGQVVSGPDITSVVTITALIPTTGGTGGVGTYTVTNSTNQTISTAVNATAISYVNNYSIRASYGGLDFLNNSAVNAGGGSSKIYFSSAGNVGIGTSSPGVALDVVGTGKFSTSLSIGTIGYTIDDYATNNQIRLYTTTAGKSLWVNAPGGITLNNNTYVTGNLQVAATTTDVYANIINTATGGRSWFINATSNASGEGAGRLLFKDGTASATRMTIDASGNVGIGTTAPDGLLGFKNTATFADKLIHFPLSTNTLYLRPTGTGGQLQMWSDQTSANVMTWTTAGNVGIATDSPTSTLHANGSFSANITSVTAAITLSSAHCVVYCSGTTSYAVTLPTAVGITGRMYYIKKTSTSTYTLTISTTSSQTIDGGTSLAFTAQYASYTVISNGSNWLII